MIKIIKPGRIRTATCPYCDCVFSFTKGDLKCSYEAKEEIDCPYCGETIEVFGVEDGNDNL